MDRKYFYILWYLNTTFFIFTSQRITFWRPTFALRVWKLPFSVYSTNKQSILLVSCRLRTLQGPHFGWSYTVTGNLHFLPDCFLAHASSDLVFCIWVDRRCWWSHCMKETLSWPLGSYFVLKQTEWMTWCFRLLSSKYTQLFPLTSSHLTSAVAFENIQNIHSVI